MKIPRHDRPLPFLVSMIVMLGALLWVSPTFAEIDTSAISTILTTTETLESEKVKNSEGEKTLTVNEEQQSNLALPKEGDIKEATRALATTEIAPEFLEEIMNSIVTIEKEITDGNLDNNDEFCEKITILFEIKENLPENLKERENEINEILETNQELIEICKVGTDQEVDDGSPTQCNTEKVTGQNLSGEIEEQIKPFIESAALVIDTPELKADEIKRQADKAKKEADEAKKAADKAKKEADEAKEAADNAKKEKKEDGDKDEDEDEDKFADLKLSDVFSDKMIDRLELLSKEDSYNLSYHNPSAGMDMFYAMMFQKQFTALSNPFEATTTSIDPFIQMTKMFSLYGLGSQDGLSNNNRSFELHYHNSPSMSYYSGVTADMADMFLPSKGVPNWETAEGRRFFEFAPI